MTWALWLAVPAGLTLLAALVTWFRSRPEKLPDTAEAMQAHSEYLDALARTAFGEERVEPGSLQRGPD